MIRTGSTSPSTSWTPKSSRRPSQLWLVCPSTSLRGNEELFSEYLDARREAVKACPIKVITGGAVAHGNIDTSLAIKESHTYSDWDGNPRSLMGEKILNHGDVTEACWGGELKEWAEKLGLPWSKIEKANPDGPRWIMIVSQG